jgi:hypothetical protein
MKLSDLLIEAISKKIAKATVKQQQKKGNYKKKS